MKLPVAGPATVMQAPVDIKPQRLPICQVCQDFRDDVRFLPDGGKIIANHQIERDAAAWPICREAGLARTARIKLRKSVVTRAALEPVFGRIAA